jgi:hypothetical protein
MVPTSESLRVSNTRRARVCRLPPKSESASAQSYEKRISPPILRQVSVPGDVEVTGAEGVANANVFHGLGLSSDDCVSSLSAGNYCESSSGAEKKALDVHY